MFATCTCTSAGCKRRKAGWNVKLCGPVSGTQHAGSKATRPLPL